MAVRYLAMCGRFLNSLPPEEVRRWFKTTNPLPNFGARYNIAPTDTVPVVRLNAKTKERSLDLLRWGLIPSWAKDEKIGVTMINARAEELATKPAFRDALRKRRCLVPANGFYEWQKLGPKEKQPYFIRVNGGEPFAFAGLWEGWKKPGSDTWLRSFTIVTTKANDLCAPIHERMPVILEPGTYGRWLGAEGDGDPPLDLLRPFPSERMEVRRVGAAVGNVRNDGPELALPIDA